LALLSLSLSLSPSRFGKKNPPASLTRIPYTKDKGKTRRRWWRRRRRRRRWLKPPPVEASTVAPRAHPSTLLAGAGAKTRARRNGVCASPLVRAASKKVWQEAGTKRGKREKLRSAVEAKSVPSRKTVEIDQKFPSPKDLLRCFFSPLFSFFPSAPLCSKTHQLVHSLPFFVSSGSTFFLGEVGARWALGRKGPPEGALRRAVADSHYKKGAEERNGGRASFFYDHWALPDFSSHRRLRKFKASLSFSSFSSPSPFLFLSFPPTSY